MKKGWILTGRRHQSAQGGRSWRFPKAKTGGSEVNSTTVGVDIAKSGDATRTEPNRHTALRMRTRGLDASRNRIDSAATAIARPPSIACEATAVPKKGANPVLVLAALEMAIGQRKPSNVIHHRDQGSCLSSTGRRNSSVRRFHKLVQSLGRCSPSKRLARTTIQRCRHGGKRVDAVHAQVRALRKVLAQ